jgi:SET domain-containing protein
MLKVKTYIDKSPIHGIGLFADEDIPKGTLVWEFSDGYDISLSRFGDLITKIQRDFLVKYSFFDKQLHFWILSADDDRFTNHSEDPNTIPLDNGKMVAARDIKSGEEITANYYEIDDYADDKLLM